MKPNFVAIGAGAAALGVMLGAFGAHALRGSVGPRELELWETATRYLFIGAFGMTLYGLFQRSTGRGSLAGWFLLAGSALFASSLYALALGAPRALGAITPFGGASLIAGFICFAISAARAS
ncbi:MAG TPA: DUF423 domain-containing protein [Polyangiaceae bacterium]|jgi:uncharacterized membrane protein YgdD (TMEM256/DUF423 family)|nr:DUF423 domain-containing protein [Polyangiaceae bacterium]